MITLHFLHELALVIGSSALLVSAIAIVFQLRRKNFAFARTLLLLFVGCLLLLIAELSRGRSDSPAAILPEMIGAVCLCVGAIRLRRLGSLWQS
jgi:hypothetical protein